MVEQNKKESREEKEFNKYIESVYNHGFKCGFDEGAVFAIERTTEYLNAIKKQALNQVKKNKKMKIK